VVDDGARHLATTGDIDADQVVAYDLAHAAAAVENARAVLDYGLRGEAEARIACAFVADAVCDVATKTYLREATWGIEPGALGDAADFVGTYRAPEYLEGLCGEQGPRHLDPDFALVQDTFRRFAEDEIRPVAEEIHRKNEDIPEPMIEGLAEIGTFGVSVPEEYAALDRTALALRGTRREHRSSFERRWRGRRTGRVASTPGISSPPVSACFPSGVDRTDLSIPPAPAPRRRL
jgi:(2S)-methylsuccinyl-CoA dehydrogenase